MMTGEVVPAPSIVLTSEQTRHQLEVTSEPIFAPIVCSTLVTTGLVVITSICSPVLVVEPEPMITSPTSLVASTLVSMRTPPSLLPISSAQLTAAPTTPSTIVTTSLRLQDHSLTWSGRGREGVCGRGDTFYRSLKRCISLVERFDQSF